MLHEWFPQRIPGELDDRLDMLRFLRMIEAKDIMAAEDARTRFFDNGAKPPEPGNQYAYQQYLDNLRKWADHDELIRLIDGTD